MDKLFIDQGGHHLLGDDLEFLENICQEPLKAFAETLGLSLLALSGVEITIGSGLINWTAGWIYINGEICQVPAGSAAYPANDTFVIVQTPDPAGNQVYEDLNTVDTYLLRRAVIQGNAGGANLHSNLAYVKDYMMTRAVPQASLVAAVGANWFINTADLFVTKTPNGEVVFNGKLETSSYNNSTGDVALTLPIIYRPGDVYTLLVPAVINGTRTSVHVEVNGGTGDVTPMGLTNGDNVILIMEGLRYPY